MHLIILCVSGFLSENVASTDLRVWLWIDIVCCTLETDGVIGSHISSGR